MRILLNIEESLTQLLPVESVIQFQSLQIPQKVITGIYGLLYSSIIDNKLIKCLTSFE
ncbi:MAG TPA: hypothetical protein VJT54_03820 [Verrucomicrobiae bacterium]|nr:hypothetical protein [Verrucomicrobiae bacterium]